MKVRLRPLGRADGAALLGNIAGPDEMRARLVALCAGLLLALRIVRERLAGLTGAEVSRFADDLGDRHARLNRLSLSEGGVEIGVRPVLAASYAALSEVSPRFSACCRCAWAAISGWTLWPPAAARRHRRCETCSTACSAPIW